VQPFQRALRRIRGQPGLHEPDHLAAAAKVGRELLIVAGYDARQMICLDDTYALRPKPLPLVVGNRHWLAPHPREVTELRGTGGYRALFASH
jgi:hypothetical protein